MLVVAGLVLVVLLGDSSTLLVLLGRAGAVVLRPLVLILVTLLALGVLAVRVVATRRSLACRTRLLVLAPDSFDPSLDAVLRCAAQLSRVRRLVGGWLDPRARAVRVLLDCDPEGRMRYSLTVPARALPAVRSALGSFDRVQAHLIDDTNPEPRPDEEAEEDGSEDRVAVVRAELRLARPSSEPLAHLGLSPDPLQNFAGVLAGLDPGRGEQAEIAIDLLPVVPGARRRLRRRLLRNARRYDGQANVREQVGVFGARRAG